MKLTLVLICLGVFTYTEANSNSSPKEKAEQLKAGVDELDEADELIHRVSHAQRRAIGVRRLGRPRKSKQRRAIGGRRMGRPRNHKATYLNTEIRRERPIVIPQETHLNVRRIDMGKPRNSKSKRAIGGRRLGRPRNSKVTVGNVRRTTRSPSHTNRRLQVLNMFG